MSAKPYLYVSSAIFTLVAIMHVLRLVNGWPVQVGDASIAAGVSWAGVAVAGALALWGFRAARSA